MIDQEINCHHLFDTPSAPHPIAIYVTNQQKQSNDNCLTVTPQVLLNRKGSLRSKEQHHRKVRTHQQIRSHPLQKEQSSGIKRTRRISSSTAAKRFPKDFFMLEPKSKPSGLAKCNLSQQFPNLLDTFSHQFLVVRSQHEEAGQSDSSNCQKTPEFTKKDSSKQAHSGGYLGDRYANNRFLAKINRFIALKENLCLFRRADDRGHTIKKQKQVLKEVTCKSNNLAVPLGQKVKRALVLRRQKEKNLFQRDKPGDEQQCFKGNHNDLEFRIRKKGGL